MYSSFKKLGLIKFLYGFYRNYKTDIIIDLYEKYYLECINYLLQDSTLLCIIKLTSEGYITNLIKLFDTILLNNFNNELIKDKEPSNFNEILESIFIFCLIWSVGCNTDTNGRKEFNKYFLELLLNNKPKYNIQIKNETDMIYDFIFDLYVNPEP